MKKKQSLYVQGWKNLKTVKDIPNYWFLEYLGKPWKPIPDPPNSYNCGELVRSIYLDLFNIKTNAIPINNAQSSLQCARAMQPEIFDLLPIPGNEEVKEFDVCFMGRKTFIGHCGIAVNTSEGLRILHCPEASCGVTIHNFIELQFMGFPSIKWFRHKDFCQC